MTIEELRHVIRACKDATHHTEFLIVGSQVILGYYSDKELNASLKKSREVDIVPIPNNQEISDIIDGVLGEFSPFDNTFNIYAHGNDLSTAIFPNGWKERINSVLIEGCTIHFPSLEDFAIAKYISGREKDLDFVREMWKAEYLDKDVIETLVKEIPNDRVSMEKINVTIKKIEADIEKYCCTTIPKLG